MFRCRSTEHLAIRQVGDMEAEAPKSGTEPVPANSESTAFPIALDRKVPDNESSLRHDGQGAAEGSAAEGLQNLHIRK